MREAAPPLPGQAALGRGARRGRGAPRGLRLLPEALRLRGAAEDVGPPGGGRGDGARPEAENLRPAEPAHLRSQQVARAGPTITTSGRAFEPPGSGLGEPQPIWPAGRGGGATPAG